MTDIQLIVEPDSLTKTRTESPVWGEVYFRGGQFSFPTSGWTDIAVGLCLYWIETLREIQTGNTEHGTVHFMDGPYKVRLRRVAGDSVHVEMIESREQDLTKYRVSASLNALIRNAVLVAQNVLRTCEQHGWADADILALASMLEKIELR